MAAVVDLWQMRDQFGFLLLHGATTEEEEVDTTDFHTGTVLESQGGSSVRQDILESFLGRKRRSIH